MTPPREHSPTLGFRRSQTAQNPGLGEEEWLRACVPGPACSGGASLALKPCMGTVGSACG